MDCATTLTTFMLQTVPAIRSVDLLGSWDNFSKRYPMEKDLRRGRGTWRGCHSFEDILHEGPSLSTSKKRAGGLKMGGTYWYFYVLDGDVEFHNPAEPSTTVCPLLPGQPVNVVEVPIEFGPEQTRDRSQSTADMNLLEPAARTMDPADKFVNPRAAPKPRHSRLSSAPASMLKLFGKSTRALAVASSSQPFRSQRCGGPVASATLSRLLSPRMPSVCASASDGTAQPTKIRRTSAPSSKRGGGVVTLDGHISRQELIKMRNRSSPTTAQVDKIASEPCTVNLLGLSRSAQGELSGRYSDDEPPFVTVGATQASIEQEDGPISNEVGTPLLQFNGTEDLVQALDVRRSSLELAAALPDRYDMASKVPTLLQQLGSAWTCSASAVEKPVTSHFSLWSTPSVRSVSSSYSDDVLEIASPGLTHGGSYGSPLSEGISARAFSSCPSVIHGTDPSTDVEHVNLSLDRFWQRESVDQPRDSLDSLASSSTDWASTSQGSWKPWMNFEGYRLPEKERRSEVTLRKFTGTGSDHPVSPMAFSDPFDIDRGILPRSEDASGFSSDLQDDLGYLSKIITYN